MWLWEVRAIESICFVYSLVGIFINDLWLRRENRILVLGWKWCRIGPDDPSDSFSILLSTPRLFFFPCGREKPGIKSLGQQQPKSSEM